MEGVDVNDMEKKFLRSGKMQRSPTCELCKNGIGKFSAGAAPQKDEGIDA